MLEVLLEAIDVIGTIWIDIFLPDLLTMSNSPNSSTAAGSAGVVWVTPLLGATLVTMCVLGVTGNLYTPSPSCDRPRYGARLHVRLHPQPGRRRICSIWALSRSWSAPTSPTTGSLGKWAAGCCWVWICSPCSQRVLLVAMSLERYRAVAAPFRARRSTVRIHWLMALGIWVAAFVLTLPMMLMIRARGTSQYGGPRQNASASQRGRPRLSRRIWPRSSSPACSSPPVMGGFTQVSPGITGPPRLTWLTDPRRPLAGADWSTRWWEWSSASWWHTGRVFCRSGVGRWRSSSRPSRSALCRPPLTPTSTSSSPAWHTETAASIRCSIRCWRATTVTTWPRGSVLRGESRGPEVTAGVNPLQDQIGWVQKRTLLWYSCVHIGTMLRLTIWSRKLWNFFNSFFIIGMWHLVTFVALAMWTCKIIMEMIWIC